MPFDLNIYSKDIFNKTIEDVDCEVTINGMQVNNFCYTDDTVLLSNDTEGSKNITRSIIGIPTGLWTILKY